VTPEDKDAPEHGQGPNETARPVSSEPPPIIAPPQPAAQTPYAPPPTPAAAAPGLLTRRFNQAIALIVILWRFLAAEAQALAGRAVTLAGLGWKSLNGLLERKPKVKGPPPKVTWRRPGDEDRPPLTGWQKAMRFAGYSAGALTAAIIAFAIYVTWDMPSTDDLWSATDNPSLTFVDRNGRVILREGAQNAPPVDLAKLPPYVPQAVIAIEDRRFYQHVGVDFEGLSRAMVQNLQAGRVVQGGSTITQQLAKNLFLSNDRTFRRKAQEVILALWLERRFSKDQILALYLSRVYFGAGAWGVEAAAERYFDRPAKELSLKESALLAGLLKAPSRLNPAQQEENATARANVVLAEMRALGFIDDVRLEEARSAPLMVSRSNPAGNLGYFRNWIDPLLNDVIGQQRDDFVIETTLDLDTQRAGERALDSVLAADGEKMNVTQGAVLVMDSDGGVRGMIGGRGFGDSQFNRTTQARRQPGSAFKYFIYLAAMEQGISPYAVRDDAPLTIGDWSPGNYDDEYFGPVPLTTAFAKSLNMVAIRVAEEAGHKNVINTAKRLGVRTDIKDYRSLALGAQEMNLMEITAAFGAMAADGAKLNPFGVVRITRASNQQAVYTHRGERVKVIEDEPLRDMNLLMKRVVDAGTGTKARIQGRDVAGKTGTGNDYRDAWFIGFTPGMVGGVWVGNDNFATTKKVTGGSLPARIWQQTMTVAVRDLEKRSLLMPTAPPPADPLPGEGETSETPATTAGPDSPEMVNAPPPQPEEEEAPPA
jgi:penicillin-binding protein 1A